MSRIVYKPYVQVPETAEMAASSRLKRAESVDAPFRPDNAYGPVSDLSATSPAGGEQNPDDVKKLSAIVEITPKDVSALSRRGSASVITDLCRILETVRGRSGGSPTSTEKLFTTMLEENVRRLLLVEKGRRENTPAAR